MVRFYRRERLALVENRGLRGVEFVGANTRPGHAMYRARLADNSRPNGRGGVRRTMLEPLSLRHRWLATFDIEGVPFGERVVGAKVEGVKVEPFVPLGPVGKSASP